MSSNFGFKTTAEEAAAALQEQIRGKNVVVTGASPSTLGSETVRTIAPYAATVIIASRTPAKMDKVVEEARRGAPDTVFKTVQLDLSSAESIANAAKTIQSFNLPLHVVINNGAAPQASELTRTKEGYEVQFGSNHIGHFQFIGLLLPQIQAAATPSYKPRVVVLSSLASVISGLREDPIFKKDPENYEKWVGYGQSKTANILYAREFARRHPELEVFSLHPGAIRETAMGQGTDNKEWEALGLMDEHGNPKSDETFKNIPQGTSTTIVAAFDPALKEHSGAFLHDCKIADDALPPHAKDNDASKRLWTLSEQLTGVSY